MLIITPNALIAFRFAHGVIGGALVGTGFSVIARTLSPDRTFGVLAVHPVRAWRSRQPVHTAAGADLWRQRTFHFADHVQRVHIDHAPVLDQYPVDHEKQRAHREASGRVPLVPVALVLLSIFLFQAGNNGLFAFIIGLGKTSGLSLEFITGTLAAGGWIGLFGALLVIVIHTRFGRTIPLAVAMLATVGATWALHYSTNGSVFLAANVLVGITWAFVMSYLLGLAAAFDRTGQMAALGGFASKMGLASGPLVGGLLLGDDNYALIINIAVVALIFSMIASVIPAIHQDRAPGGRA